MGKYKITGLLFIITILAACKGSENAQDIHEENIQLVAYNDTFEVYAEATPFVTGQESDILSHFTLLKNFKPITEGKITVSLITGADRISQTVDEPTRTGIYEFALSPKTAGAAEIIFDIETPEGKSQIVVPDITVYTDAHEARQAAEETEISSSNGVVLTKEQSWRLDFATEEARIEPFGQVIRATAQILPSQGDQKIITAEAGGIVKFSGQNIVEGKSVSAGQTLFIIESDRMMDNNLSVRLSQVTAEYNRTKAEYERKKALAADKIVSESDLLKAQTEFLAAEAVYNNLRNNFSSGRQTASSPIGGFITQIPVRDGEYVEAGQIIAVVSQNRDLLIRAELQPKYYPLLGNITSANISVLNSDIRYTLEELDGKVISYGKSIEPGNPLVPVTFQVKNSIGLLPGSFVEMYIKTRSASQAITIPSESIIEEMGNYYVYIQLTPELFEKRSIKKGATDGFRTEIIEGVSVGDRVVSKGAISVKLAQASGALDAHSGHVH